MTPNIGFRLKFPLHMHLSPFSVGLQLMSGMEEKMLKCEIVNHPECYVLISLISLAKFNGISTYTCPVLEGCYYVWQIFGQRFKNHICDV